MPLQFLVEEEKRAQSFEEPPALCDLCGGLCGDRSPRERSGAGAALRRTEMRVSHLTSLTAGCSQRGFAGSRVLGPVSLQVF